MNITTKKKLSATFGENYNGTEIRYKVMKDGKPFAYCYEKELAESIVSANAGSELVEEEVYAYKF